MTNLWNPRMLLAATDAPRFATTSADGWRFPSWASRRIMTGTTDRHLEPAQIIQRAGVAVSVVRAEQVHGASIAVIERYQATELCIPGCDALVTSLPNVLLMIRTADCLPIFYADAQRGIVGIAHAGWRGIAAQLPARMLGMFSTVYGVPPEAVQVAIGPAIHACCYEVGPEFEARFGPFVISREGRRKCDLIGATIDQLQRAGARPQQIMESQHCTSCELQHWFSLRKEGAATGRMTSFVMLQP